ncbi:phosphotransferase family protein [Paenibacillus cymbidii]|uniref:phosphotransferase family protein n=1 Tax=Paenibacillus cymbidii TaxID=1639034 RepID=UPI001436AED8|nr:aminoglycoside phosphotransferase family protein [Paenibacillus cymbidii]
MKQIAAGATADIFEYDVANVLKLYRHGFAEEAIRYEYELTRAIGALGIPAPAAFGMVGHERRTGFILQRIEGTTLLQRLLLAPQELPQIAKQLAEVHAHLHGTTVDEPTASRLPIRQQQEALASGIRQAASLTEAERLHVAGHLAGLPAGQAICHGDFHPDNVMIGDRVWIIDWMNGSLGHPAGDAARSLLLLRFGTLPADISAAQKEALSRLRNQLADSYSEHYRAITNTPAEAIEAWMLPVAAARLPECGSAEEEAQLLAYIRELLPA